MERTPKSMRLHIGLFGRTNTGKSSYLNMICGQQAAIVSPVAGTTTDVVEKTMELLPLGPVVFLDTAGLDDSSVLGKSRVARTNKALVSSDVAILVTEAGVWTDYERHIADACKAQSTPLLVVANKSDTVPPSPQWLDEMRREHPHLLVSSTVDGNREQYIRELKRSLLAVCPEDYLATPTILGDLLPSRREGLPLVVLIVPVDIQAPKGRIILPQVQSIRDCLDHHASVAVVTAEDYPTFLGMLRKMPDLVVCDSQVADRMVRDTPPEVPCTTFSILFSRFKGNIELMARGGARLSTLKAGDTVLIAEACTHHPLQDDIGRVKIPRWIRENRGAGIVETSCAGKDYPSDLHRFDLVIHCGACSLTRREMLWRLEQAREQGVWITNYGIAISILQNVVERTLSPFPEALAAYREELARQAAL